MSNNIPEDYFNKLPEKIRQGIEALEDDIQDMAPILTRIKKEGIYELPKDYFAGLSARLISKNRQTKKVRLIFYRFAAAASIVLLLTFGINGFFNNGLTNNDLAENEILDYYIEYAELLDDSTLVFLETEIEGSERNYFDEFEKEELELYLSTVIDEVDIENLIETENI